MRSFPMVPFRGSFETTWRSETLYGVLHRVRNTHYTLHNNRLDQASGATNYYCRA